MGSPTDAGDLIGTIDVHIHTAPDLRPRKLDALEAARQAAARGMRAIVLKSHWVPTTDRAALAQAASPEVRVLGGLVLNESVGGFNPAAVEAALRLGAAQIWMPTVSAAAHRHPPPPSGLTLADDRGELRPGVQEVLRLVAEHDAILGTGHLSTPEIMQLVPAARTAGVRKIVVTHPEHPPVQMSAALQEELRDRFAVLFERCYISLLASADYAPIPFAALAGIIRRVGYGSTILSTDLGQPENPYPVDGLTRYLAQLRADGFPPAALNCMSRENPARLLGLAV
jgi:hypothetical protein